MSTSSSVPFKNNAAAIARAVLGEPNRQFSSRSQMRFGSQGSLSVEIAGDRAGTWFDYEANTGGGMLDLVQREKHLDKGAALEFCKGIGVPLEGSPQRHLVSTQRRIVAEYDYRDETGALLYQVLRYEPKDFRQRRADGSWKLGDVRRVLYRLPDIIANPDEPVFLVEGEKDADALARLGLVATCNAGGAAKPDQKSKWVASYSQSLKGRDVVILPDNDEAGEAHALAVARALTGIAASVRIVRLAGLPPKGDVSDWLATGGTADELTMQAAGAEVFSEPMPAAPGKASTRYPSWTGSLILNSEAVPYGNLANAMTALRHAPEIGSLFAYDEMLQSVILQAPVPAEIIVPGDEAFSPRPATDADVSAVQEWIQRNGIEKLGKDTAHQAVDLRARERGFHPVRNWFFRTFRDGYLVLRFRNWEIQKVVHFHGYSPVSRLRSLDLPRSLVVRRVVALDNRVEIEVGLRKRSAVCPDCQCPTQRIHSFYQRKLADLPWQGRPATLIVSVPRFFCQTMLCPRRTFVIPLEGITVRHGRQTTRLADLHYYIAHTLGGSAGARMTVRLCCPISADTLVRRLLSRVQNTTKGTALTRVVGVDDWAWRRGHHYGTIVVDLEKNDVIDLLPDRDADTLARWLQVHPGIEIIARDRAGTYADGCRRGAPSALQVTDRWHLLKNLSDAFVSILDRFTTTVRTLTRQMNVSTVVSKISETIRAHPEEAQAVVRSASGERRDILFKEALALKAAGHSIQAIATTIGVERKTVRRWFQRGHAPPWKRTVPSRSILVPYTAHLEKRWSEGCRNSRQLWRELLEQGFAGQYGTVWKWVATRQGCSAKPVPSAHVVAPRGRRLARLLLAEDPLSAGQEGLLVPALLEAEPHLAVTLCWLRKMQTLLCKRGDTCTGGDLKALLEEGKTTLLSRLIPALERDAAAIEASLVTPWTTSPVEGQISRLKMIKRTMFGRAGFELLRARVLQPA